MPEIIHFDRKAKKKDNSRGLQFDIPRRYNQTKSWNPCNWQNQRRWNFISTTTFIADYTVVVVYRIKTSLHISFHFLYEDWTILAISIKFIPSNYLNFASDNIGIRSRFWFFSPLVGSFFFANERIYFIMKFMNVLNEWNDCSDKIAMKFSRRNSYVPYDFRKKMYSSEIRLSWSEND